MKIILVENFDKLIKSICLIYEDNFILKCPDILKEKVEEIVMKSINENKSIKEKIFINDLLESKYLKQFSDEDLYQCLVSLFKNRDDAFILVKSERINNDDVFLSTNGSFEPPIDFEENTFRENTMHLAWPKIKDLGFSNDQRLNKFKEKYKKSLKELKNRYSKCQILLKEFKENILDFSCFGAITIFPDNCSKDKDSIEQITINDVVEHESQHCYIFLLELAKTCIFLGRVFSNEFENNLSQLNEQEFITLFGTYCNVLIRIYKRIDGFKNLNEFIKVLVDLCINDRTDMDEKYEMALKSSIQFQNIKNFYKLIYKDSHYVIKTAKEGKTANLVNLGNNDKFSKLISCTLKNFKENLKNEK